MKKYFFSMLALLSVFYITSFSQAQTKPNIEGTYTVTGTNPKGGSPYRGVATITKEGDHYLLHWTVGNIYEGSGTLKQNTLRVEWGPAEARVGVVTYKLDPNGTLKGTWYLNQDPNSLGTETLTPKK